MTHSAGCYPHVMDDQDRLPIHYAAVKGNALCVELITRLESGDGLKVSTYLYHVTSCDSIRGYTWPGN